MDILSFEQDRSRIRVGMVLPRYVDESGEYYQFPLGMAYIAGALKQAGYATFALNLNECEGDEYSQVSAFVAEHKLDVVCSGGLSTFIASLKEVFRGSKNTVKLVGGGVVGGDSLSVLDILGCDYGVLGEGEVTVVALLDAIFFYGDIGTTPGIVYREGGEIKQTEARPVLDNIDLLPWPDYELFKIQNYIDRQNVLDSHFFNNLREPTDQPRSIDVITSRSCPFMCTFCFHPIGKKYRERSVDDVIAEIKSYIDKYNVNMVQILDELFSLRKARLIEFCQKIKELDILWMVQLHTRTADHDTLSAMKESGCVYISYGIESADNSVLKSMAKKTTVEVIDKCLEMTYEHDIGIQGNLIFGDTNETLETANNSMGWWARNMQLAVYLSRIQVFPGSPDYIMACRDGLITSRKGFTRQLPTNLNISNINCINYSSMMFQLRVHGRTLLNLVESNFYAAEQDNLFDIEFQCPKCESRNRFENSRLRAFHRFFIRLFCKHCHHRADVVNLSFVDDTTHHHSQGYTNPANVGGGSMFDTILAAEKDSGDDDEVILEQARFVYAHADNAVHSAGERLLGSPFSIDAHHEFGIALARAGCGSAAMLHFDQADLLSRILPGETDQLAQTVRRQAVAKLGEEVSSQPFFVSYSDEEPLYRASRDAGGYKNKEEPDFPDFKNLIVARSA